MAVYVDTIFTRTPRTSRARRHGNEWCHMTADTRVELDDMAEKIGLKLTYLQFGLDGRRPHYDLTPTKRAAAVMRGAIEESWRERARRQRTDRGR